jgi:hypothetical protein
METLTRFYSSLAAWIGFTPIFIVGVAIFVTIRMSRYKWIVHVLTFSALLLTLPVYIWIRGILDPTTIEYPGPGEGFIVLIYLFYSVPMIVAYATYAWLTRRKSQMVVSTPLR